MLMKSRYVFALWGSISLAITTASCSEEAAQEVTAHGTVQLSLLGTSSSGVTYRLRHAVFEITGPSPARLSTEAAPDATTLSKELPAGDYSAFLAAGWRLQKQTSSGDFEGVKAVLTSPNPATFGVVDQRTTTLRFRFKVGEDRPQQTIGLALRPQRAGPFRMP
jgi:hypothetical protein